MIEDWSPYQGILRNIWCDWHERMEREGVFDRCEEEYMQFQMAQRRRSSEERLT